MWKSKLGIIMGLVFLAVGLVISLGSIVLAESAEGAKQKVEMKSATVVGSEIKATGESSCENNKKWIQKVLVLKTKTEGGTQNEETQRWWESTDQNCEQKSGETTKEAGTVLPPPPSDESKNELKTDAEMRAEEVQQWCGTDCYATASRYECWSRNRYLVQYCYNECGEYTGFYYYWYRGKCW